MSRIVPTVPPSPGSTAAPSPHAASGGHLLARGTAESGPGVSPDPAIEERDARNAHRCRLAREIASVVLDVPMAEIQRANRSIAETCRARHLAIYLAHVSFQVPLSAIADSFGRDRTSVAHAVRRIEDARDDPAVEHLVARLERLADACVGEAAETSRGAEA